jgi:hypothetical protein
LSAYRLSRAGEAHLSKYWLLLAIGCTLLSLDEAAQLHEMLGGF